MVFFIVVFGVGIVLMVVELSWLKWGSEWGFVIILIVIKLLSGIILLFVVWM